MLLKEMNKKANFIQEEYTKLARKINRDVSQLWYVHDSNTFEEYLIIEYNHGATKKICITANSLSAIVQDTVDNL